MSGASAACCGVRPGCGSGRSDLGMRGTRLPLVMVGRSAVIALVRAAVVAAALVVAALVVAALVVAVLVSAALVAPDRDETIADVADRADERLMVGAELGPQAAHVHVDGPGAAEVVVAPHLLEQLGPGKDPARVLGQELQQLELLERQVERVA